MPGFLYYLPNKTTAKLSDVQAAGLGYAFDKAVVPRGCRGPDGGDGVVCGTTADKLGYFPDKQTWRKIPGAEAWVGYYTDEPPTPDDLAREEQLGGHWVKLCDGRKWLCPVARALAEQDGRIGWFRALPGVLKLDDSGEWVSGDVEARYLPLWGLAEAYWDQFSKSAEEGDGSVAFDFPRLHDAAVLCLCANYRLGRAEAAMLGLFDDREEKATSILLALVDWPSYEAILKKKPAADTSPGGDG